MIYEKKKNKYFLFYKDFNYYKSKYIYKNCFESNKIT